MCGGYAQGNLVVLPKEMAYDFLLFAQRNPKPCPLLEVSDEGSREFSITAPGSDIARDIPKYRVYENGVLTGEYEDISSFWRGDFVSFLIGCSFTFESPMMEEGVPVRHIENGSNVPMYITNIECKSAGMFSGPMVCSMRPIPGQPGEPRRSCFGALPQGTRRPRRTSETRPLIGIRDVMKPEFGDPPDIRPGEIPVFWACGVTPQAVCMNTKPPIVITHAPGYMFITDVKNGDLSD